MLALVACVCAILVVPSLGGGALPHQDAVVPEEDTVSPLSDEVTSLTEVADNVTVVGVTVNETIKVPYPDAKQESGHVDNKIYSTKFAPPTPAPPKPPKPGKPTPAPTIIYGDSRDIKVTKKGRLISGPGNRRRTGDGFGKLYYSPKPPPLTNKVIDKIEGKHKLLKDAWGYKKLKSYTSAELEATKQKKEMKKMAKEAKAYADAMTPKPPSKKVVDTTPYKKGVHIITKAERKAEEKEEAQEAKVSSTPSKKEVKKAMKRHDLLKTAFKKKSTNANDPLMTADLPKSMAQDLADKALAKAAAKSNDNPVPVNKAPTPPKHCGGCVALKTFCEEITQKCHACPVGASTCGQTYMLDSQAKNACEAAVKEAKCAAPKKAAPSAKVDSCPTEVGINFRGPIGDEDVKKTTASSVGACSTKCDANAACQYFVYAMNTGDCYLKKNLTHKQKDGTAISGMRCAEVAKSVAKPVAPTAASTKALTAAKAVSFVPVASKLIFDHKPVAAYTGSTVKKFAGTKYQITGDFTVSIWAKPTKRTVDWSRLIGKGAFKTRNYGLWINAQGYALAQVYGSFGHKNAWVKSSAGTVPLNKWTHLALVYKKGGYVALYMNGKLVKKVTSTSGQPATDTLPLTLGKADFHTGFIGDLKEAKVWKGAALSGSQVLQVFSPPKVVPKEAAAQVFVGSALHAPPMPVAKAKQTVMVGTALHAPSPPATKTADEEEIALFDSDAF